MASPPPPPPPQPEVVEDFFGYVKVYSDGSIYRSNNNNPRNLLLHDHHYTNTVHYKDCLFDKQHNLYLRLYKPATPPFTKLPILFYFHGGGFCGISRGNPRPHNLCFRLAEGLQALVISLYYRLAPEHRLPAAVDDGLNALRWLQGQGKLRDSGDEKEVWLCEEVVDFDNVFVFGDSSGGNMAHHLAVRLTPGSVELEPVRVRGYVMLTPFFGGMVRTKREEERPCEAFWSQHIFDQMWRLAAPVGSDRDHPLVNPFGPSSPSLENVGLDPILVMVGGEEVLSDRVKEYARRLKEMGKNIEIVVFEEKEHGFFTEHPRSEMAETVLLIVKGFMSHNSKN
ncbi:probable carboxylesterase 15 [Tripterygium wilfordii]|uniref:probable carboxylesterase 15 n=1 Tax=Tripterygium wilfordii TaxID=458696 RepID=UPI0018F855E8|nr:probable carboxylesterase 15 [Tripterygium wilfordii]